MKKAAKILCIIALIIGLIWAIVGFFGVWFGGAVVGTVEGMSQNSQAAEATMGKSANIMIRLLVSFVVVIIGGVLGIVGAGKESSKLKLIIFGVLMFICGCLLFPLSNYVAAVLYLVAGLLLVLAGLTIKRVENTDTKAESLVGAFISIGIVLVAVVGTYFVLKESSEKETKISNEVVIDEQQEQSDAIDNLGIWKIKYFVDDFGEATKEGYIATTIVGTFSNRMTRNSNLGVVLFITNEETIYMRLYEYDGNSPKVLQSETSYKVLVKDSKEEVHTLYAHHDYDELFFSSAESKKLYNILVKGGTIKFNIVASNKFESRAAEYNFTIDNADGLENTMTKLIRNNKANEVSSKTKNEDFESFIQKFTSDKEYQLSHIKFPLRLVKSKDKWEFLSTNDIFKGVKKQKDMGYRGAFEKESDNKYRYTLYMVFESDYLEDGGELNFGIDFSKINGEWMVTDIFYGGEE